MKYITQIVSEFHKPTLSLKKSITKQHFQDQVIKKQHFHDPLDTKLHFHSGEDISDMS